MSWPRPLDSRRRPTNANKENLTSSQDSRAKEPFFRAPKLLWVSGCRPRGDGAGAPHRGWACCELEPRVLLRVEMAAKDSRVACEMKYIVVEPVPAKYHLTKKALYQKSFSRPRRSKSASFKSIRIAAVQYPAKRRSPGCVVMSWLPCQFTQPRAQLFDCLCRLIWRKLHVIARNEAAAAMRRCRS